MEKAQSPARQTSREFIGTVVSSGALKTVVVKIDEMKLHPKYKKHYRVSKKYHVHDAKGEAKKGDSAVFTECRPLSKTKKWRLLKIVGK